MNMFSERVQTRAEQRDTTRRAVVHAASTLFREQGFAATTIRQIAEAAGVSVGTVMAAGDKDSLLVATFDEGIAAVHANRPAPAEVGRRLAVEDAAARILALVLPFLELFEADIELARHYGSVLFRGGYDAAAMNGLASTLQGEFAAVLEQAGLEPDDAARSAETIYLAYLGVLFSWAGGAIGPEHAPATIRAVVLSVVGGGVR